MLDFNFNKQYKFSELKAKKLYSYQGFCDDFFDVKEEDSKNGVSAIYLKGTALGVKCCLAIIGDDNIDTFDSIDMESIALNFNETCDYSKLLKIKFIFKFRFFSEEDVETYVNRERIIKSISFILDEREYPYINKIISQLLTS